MIWGAGEKTPSSSSAGATPGPRRESQRAAGGDGARGKNDESSRVSFRGSKNDASSAGDDTRTGTSTALPARTTGSALPDTAATAEPLDLLMMDFPTQNDAGMMSASSSSSRRSEGGLNETMSPVPV